MKLENFFEKNQVINLKNTEKQMVIKEMILKLEDLGLIENADRYYAQVIHRESLENTGIGSSFAIPHARTESVSKFISIFAKAKDGIDYQSYDGKPVKYILLSIFPTDMSTKYLYLVGMMARIFSDKKKRKLLEEAVTPAKIYSTLNKEAKSYFESISRKSEPGPGGSENFAGVPSSDLDLLIRLDRLYHLFDEGDTTESITKKIEELKKLINNKSLTYYERMRKKCQNPFSIVEKHSCTGCHLEIPPIHLQQIKESKSISVCTHCGRFLIVI